MRFTYFADLHLRGKNPINRKDDYYQSVLVKFKEIFSTAKERKCNFIISGGDNLDSPLVSLPICDEFIDIIEEHRIPFYTIWGNHEQIGHDTSLSKSATLNHMFRRSKLIKHLDNLMFDSCYIEGYDYRHNIEKDLKEKGLFIPTTAKTLKGLKIAVVHAMITPKPILPQIMHVQMEDIMTDFDIILCGHNHYAWDIQNVWNIEKSKSGKFINIGAIGRRSINEINFTPKVVYIDTETRKIEFIPLKSAKKGEEVFDLAKVENAKVFEANIDDFIKSLDSTKFQSLDLKGLVELLAKEKNIEKEVKEEVINRIGGVEDDS